MAGEFYKHIFLSGPSYTTGFTNPQRGSSDPRFPTREHAAHAANITKQLEEAWNQNIEKQVNLHVEREGVYLDFISEPDFELQLTSLETIRSGVRLLNVRNVETQDGLSETIATVFIPHSKRGHFLRKINAYGEEPDEGNEPKNRALVTKIAGIHASIFESFWQDSIELIPSEEEAWVEIWLNNRSDSVEDSFDQYLMDSEIQALVGKLKFPERTIGLIHANKSQLIQLIEHSDDIAEIRAAKEVATYFTELENKEQLDLVRDLLSRTNTDSGGQEVFVCILDTGVNSGHLLIRPFLDTSNLHTVDSGWGVHDDTGHGTLMAGTVAYGDLIEVLNSGQSFTVNHKLESSKILPPSPGSNPSALWGYMTSQGVSLAEINNPESKRIFCMAITSIDDRDMGRPSSWSAMVDSLASGYLDDKKRLMILSAGNVYGSGSWQNYPIDNLTNEIHDPGQAWNALTVGAFTEKIAISDSTMVGFHPLAPEGGLSPYSTTSYAWNRQRWPIKPDVVFEGGNVAAGPNNSFLDHDDLQLLSTYHDTTVAQFASFNATSAASALAARMGAVVQSKYPDLWPETVRALIIHSAHWTKAMLNHCVASSNPTKKEYSNLLRIYGYGVPNLEDAIQSASNSLTMISESSLQPFDYQKSRYVTRDMHLYNLPWPTDILQDLGNTQVKMRITLSYFIEPSPGEVGWYSRYRYSSHALRFAVNGPGESETNFVKRINDQARDDNGHPGTSGPSDKWVIGEATRNVGSIHSDIWEGLAAELAASNRIAIYPTVGWWRERQHLGRWNKQCRYSLIVSIHTPEQSDDIYIPVAQQIGLTIPIEI